MISAPMDVKKVSCRRRIHGKCDDEYKAWVGCVFTTVFTQGGLDCQVDCDAVPSGDKDNDSDGALGLTTTLTAAAVAVAAAF